MLARQKRRMALLYWPTKPSSWCLLAARLDFHRLANCSCAVRQRVRCSAARGKPNRQEPKVYLPQYGPQVCSIMVASLAMTTRSLGPRRSSFNHRLADLVQMYLSLRSSAQVGTARKHASSSDQSSSCCASSFASPSAACSGRRLPVTSGTSVQRRIWACG